MQKLITIVIAIFMVSQSAFAQPDTLWTQTFGASYSDVGNSVQQTSDGGFIVVGNTSSFGNGSQIYLIKTDALGNEQWTQKYLIFKD